MAAMAAPAPSLQRLTSPPVVAVVLLAIAVMQLPQGVQPWVLVVAAGAGLPHGGLDHLVGRRVFAPRYGRWWPAPFLGGYAGLACGVLLLWRLVPGPALGGFLLLSTLHFGAEDARAHGPADPLGVLAHGGALVVVPAITHPRETAQVFEALAGPAGLQVQRLAEGPAAVLWLAAVATLSMRSGSGRRGGLTEIAALSTMFGLASPLIGFSVYFALVHTPRAFRSQARTLEMRADRWALLGALPLAGLALILGVALFWRLADAALAPALVRTTFVLLSALTVPHMWLDWLEGRVSG